MTLTHGPDLQAQSCPVGADGKLSFPPPAGLLEERTRELEAEVLQLQEALHSQRRIGVAIGLLAQRYDCTIDQSWRLLVRLSQNTNAKVRVVAQVITDAFEGVSRPEDAELLAGLAGQLPEELDARTSRPA